MLTNVRSTLQTLLSDGDTHPLLDLAGPALAATHQRRRRLHHRQQEALLPGHNQLVSDHQQRLPPSPEERRQGQPTGQRVW